MKTMFSVKAIPMLTAAVLAPRAILAQTSGDQKTLTGIVMRCDVRPDSHDERQTRRGMLDSRSCVDATRLLRVSGGIVKKPKRKPFFGGGS
jgi:hypothetical protein